MGSVVLAAITRWIVTILGVTGVVGIEGDLTKVAGAIMTAGALAWSLYEKIRDNRKGVNEDGQS